MLPHTYRPYKKVTPPPSRPPQPNAKYSRGRNSPASAAPKRSCEDPGAGVHEPIPLAPPPALLQTGTTVPLEPRRRTTPPPPTRVLPPRDPSVATAAAPDNAVDDDDECRRARQSARLDAARCDNDDDMDTDDGVDDLKEAFLAAAPAVALAAAPPLWRAYIVRSPPAVDPRCLPCLPYVVSFFSLL